MQSNSNTTVNPTYNNPTSNIPMAYNNASIAYNNPTQTQTQSPYNYNNDIYKTNSFNDFALQNNTTAYDYNFLDNMNSPLMITSTATHANFYNPTCNLNINNNDQMMSDLRIKRYNSMPVNNQNYNNFANYYNANNMQSLGNISELENENHSNLDQNNIFLNNNSNNSNFNYFINDQFNNNSGPINSKFRQSSFSNSNNNNNNINIKKLPRNAITNTKASNKDKMKPFQSVINFSKLNTKSKSNTNSISRVGSNNEFEANHQPSAKQNIELPSLSQNSNLLDLNNNDVFNQYTNNNNLTADALNNIGLPTNINDYYNSPNYFDLNNNNNNNNNSFNNLNDQETSYIEPGNTKPDQDVDTVDIDSDPRQQPVRYAGDMYTPQYVRYQGHKKEGLCDLCKPNKWLQLKNSAFWYHKQFYHGISSISGQFFKKPTKSRKTQNNTIEGLCHQCNLYVPVNSSKKKNSVLWFRHAHKCHVYNKPKSLYNTSNLLKHNKSSPESLTNDIYNHQNSNNNNNAIYQNTDNII